MPLINKTILMSGADYFNDQKEINALMDSSIAVDHEGAMKEHKLIADTFKKAGIKVIQVKPPADCQDGIYTANWGLIRNGKVIPSRLPNSRQPEEPYARNVLKNLGLEIIDLPDNIQRFSGQGDFVISDNLVFCQTPYRTEKKAHKYVEDLLGYETIVLKTKPSRWFKFGPAKTNKVTGWPDSPTYDIDLATAMIKPKTATSKALVAYCPKVFKRSSRNKLAKLDSVDKILVSKKETITAYCLNLVSTGETVIMNGGAPNFKTELVKHGLKVEELTLKELNKGGGSIRCCSLTIE